MKNVSLFFAATLTLCFTLFTTSCSKTDLLDPVVTPEPEVFEPTLPDASRLTISFAHSTYAGGCMPTFRNCIVISWRAHDFLDGNLAGVRFDPDAPVTETYGHYFPLTSDYDIKIEEPGTIGSWRRIPAGIYPIRETSAGKTVIFSPDNQHLVAPLSNPNNPQDNIGQLHNYAMQAILTTDNLKEMYAATAAGSAEKLVATKAASFLEENEVSLKKGETDRVAAAKLPADYADYATHIKKSRLSQRDQKVLIGILDEVSKMPVNSVAELDRFVQAMTKHENALAANDQLDNEKLVMSALSITKYSRYYWFWKTASGGVEGNEQQRIKWWVADLIGLLEGGILQCISYSIEAILTK